MATGVVIYTKGHFILDVDPVLIEVLGVKLWYYGLSYTLGFLCLFAWAMARRRSIGLSGRQVWDLSILFSLFSLIGGRIFEIFVYEWGLYRDNYLELFAFWHGGMALNGVILGALCGVALFCLIYKKKFFLIADELVIPFSFFLALICIGKHLNGEAYGYVTDVWWAVKFPYTEGFRHPMALYDALKDLCLIPVLVSVGKEAVAGQGRLVGHFIFWYCFPAVFIDSLRDQDPLFLTIGTSQIYNALVAFIGLLLIIRSYRKDPNKKLELNTLHFAPAALIARLHPGVDSSVCFRAVLFLSILLFSLTIPSGWSQQWFIWFISRNGI